MCVDLLSQDYVWDFMECVEPMGIHMINEEWDMKLNQIHYILLRMSGRVSHQHQSLLSALLTRLFTLTQVLAFMVGHLDEVDVIIKRAMQLEGDDWKIAVGKLKTIYISMQTLQVKSLKRGSRGAGYAICECMNATFLQHLGLTMPVKHLLAIRHHTSGNMQSWTTIANSLKTC